MKQNLIFICCQRPITNLLEYSGYGAADTLGRRIDVPRLRGIRNDSNFVNTRSRLLHVEPWFSSHYPKTKNKTGTRPVKFLVGAAGFEPTLTESESGVLPLNYAPMRRVLYNAFFCFAIKICAFGGKMCIFMILCHL